MFLLKICLFFPVNYGFFEKILHVSIPFFLKGFIHAERAHGNPCDTLEDRAIVMEIHVQPRDVFRGKCTDLVFREKVTEAFWCKRKDNLKIKGCPFSLDDAKTEVPKLPPVGIVSFGFLVKEIFVQEPVKGKLIEGRDFAFDKRKFVESVPK